MFPEFNAVFIATFGEEIKIHTQARLLRVNAIVEPDATIEHLQQVQINHQSLLLYIDETLLKNKGVERRQEITVRNSTYSINEIGSDMNGMTVIRAARV